MLNPEFCDVRHTLKNMINLLVSAASVGVDDCTVFGNSVAMAGVSSFTHSDAFPVIPSSIHFYTLYIQ